VLDNIIWYSEGGTPQWDIRDKLGTCPLSLSGDCFIEWTLYSFVLYSLPY